MAFPGGPPKSLSEIMFKKFDADNSGHIDNKEFQQLCFALGYALSPEEISLALKILDTDGSGQVDSKEFTAWWKNPSRWEDLKLDDKSLAVRQAAADTFNGFDSSKTGKLSTTDFDRFHAELVSNKLTTKDKASCLEDLDSNRDGSVQFSEYIDWLQRIGTIQVKVIAEANTGASLAPVLRKTVPGGAGGEAKGPAGGMGGITAGLAGVTLKPAVARAPSSTGPAKTATPAKAEPTSPTGAAGLKPVVARQVSTGPASGAGSSSSSASSTSPASPTAAGAPKAPLNRVVSTPSPKASEPTPAPKVALRAVGLPKKPQA